VADAWVDVGTLKAQLQTFFDANRNDLSRFGSTVNQTFEAFVFAQVTTWFKARPGWSVEIVNPVDAQGQETFRLKFSTRGRPGGYSFVRCTSPEGEVFQVRHQLRVATKHHRQNAAPPANVCLDVAVIRDVDLSGFTTYDFVSNKDLVTFGEAKHMSAFAELVAAFVGLVYEMQPARLRRIRTKKWKISVRDHPSPFLFVSGQLWRTAEGVADTIARRRLDIDVYSKTKLLASTFGLPT
jgi:hypothetical protein